MNHNSLLTEEEGGGERGGEGWEGREGGTNLLTLELIEQNESCTEMKRDRKGKKSLRRNDQEGGREGEVRQMGGGGLVTSQSPPPTCSRCHS